MSLLFEPIPGTTILHRMDERLLFLSYLLFQILVIAVPAPVSVPLLGLTILLLHTVGSGVLQFFRAARGFLLFLVLLALFSVGTRLLAGEPATDQLIYSGTLLVRLIALVMSAHLMLGILSPLGVSKVLRWTTAPLGAPGRTFSLIIVSFFALLPRLEQQLRAQREARVARAPGVSGVLRRVRYTVYPLLREGALEAERLTDAFILRGYLLQSNAGSFRFRSGRGGWLVPAGLLLLLTLAILVPSLGYRL